AGPLTCGHESVPQHASGVRTLPGEESLDAAEPHCDLTGREVSAVHVGAVDVLHESTCRAGRLGPVGPAVRVVVGPGHEPRERARRPRHVRLDVAPVVATLHLLDFPFVENHHAHPSIVRLIQSARARDRTSPTILAEGRCAYHAGRHALEGFEVTHLRGNAERVGYGRDQRVDPTGVADDAETDGHVLLLLL